MPQSAQSITAMPQQYVYHAIATSLSCHSSISNMLQQQLYHTTVASLLSLLLIIHSKDPLLPISFSFSFCHLQQSKVNERNDRAISVQFGSGRKTSGTQLNVDAVVTSTSSSPASKSASSSAAKSVAKSASRNDFTGTE